MKQYIKHIDQCIEESETFEGKLLRSVGMSKEAGFGITMGGIINMALDPLFMFVLLPRGSIVDKTK